MRKKFLLIQLISIITLSCFSQWKPAEWPILKKYDSQSLYRISMPIGGIGTGCVGLGGRGELRDWEIMNVPSEEHFKDGECNNTPYFSMWYKPQGENAKTIMLAGMPYEYEYLSSDGNPFNNHGIPRFEKAEFASAYPFGQVFFKDNSVPLQVTMKAFNPLIPADAEASGQPIAVISYEVKNKTSKPIEVSVCSFMPNFIGNDGTVRRFGFKKYNAVGEYENRNEFRSENGISGIFQYSEKVNKKSPAWGTVAITTCEKGEISHRTSFASRTLAQALLDFWDDFSADGKLTQRTVPKIDSTLFTFYPCNDSALAVKKTISANSTQTFTFYITWNFPNRTDWVITPSTKDKKIVGNWYSQKYSDAWDVAQKVIPQIPEQEKRSLDFVNALLSSDYPDAVKEAALFNLAVLRTQTVFRIPSGHLMGWEGLFQNNGSCYGSCTHVWNYEVSTAYLFGELAKTMRDVEFNYALDKDGKMSFRKRLPLSAEDDGLVAADGQLGCIMKFYRDYQFSGDKNFLKSNWDKVKLAMQYAWTPSSWDADADGVMEGKQHNTMDCDYYGPNPQMQFWYMGALASAEKMAEDMGDADFAKKCRDILKKASAYTDKELFNGEYYEHKIISHKTGKFIDEDTPDDEIPVFQLGKGCLVDQLVGQYMAHLCGLGNLASKDNARKTFESILKYNRCSDFTKEFNNMRTYVVGKERALKMAEWPKGRLKIPFPYFAEVMSGFEYCAATGMIFEGLRNEGVECIKDIRDRFNGLKRNPFSEPECGRYYARPMAAWSAIPALDGFTYSKGVMKFSNRNGKHFWSNGYAFGNCEISAHKVSLSVVGGKLNLKTLKIGNTSFKVENSNLKAGDKIIFKKIKI